MKTRLAVVSAVMVMTTCLAPRAFAQTPASGEVLHGNSLIEPAYDDRSGDTIFLLTPLGAPFPVKSNQHAASPLYLIVYPTSAAGFVGTMDCAHLGGDNCPDHGPEIAAAAAAIMPSVYGHGVWGHDHLVDGPGGSEFNVAWQVHLMLFTNATAANHHITDEDEMDAAVEAGDLIDAVPDVTTFHCNVVPERVYDLGAPVPTVP